MLLRDPFLPLDANDDNGDDNCPPTGSIGLTRIYLELTPVCNNRCPGCLNESFIHNFDDRQISSIFQRPTVNEIEWLNIIEQLPRSIKIMLSGGEPTLYRDFAHLTKEINLRGHPFVVFSNGRWTNHKKLLSHLRTCGNLKGILISLHGATANSHDSFTGIEGSFYETKMNISNAIEAGLPVKLSTVITCDNYQEIDEIVKLAQSLKAKSITFNRYLYTPRRADLIGVKVHLPTEKQLIDAIRRVERAKESTNLHIRYGPTLPQCFESSSSVGCSAGESSLVIDPWGNVKPCLQTDLLCGNILENDLETILNGDKLKMWHNLADSSCTSCDAFSQCGGGCRAMILSWRQKVDPLMRLPILKMENSLSSTGF